MFVESGQCPDGEILVDQIKVVLARVFIPLVRNDDPDHDSTVGGIGEGIDDITVAHDLRVDVETLLGTLDHRDEFTSATGWTDHQRSIWRIGTPVPIGFEDRTRLGDIAWTSG